jgi:hypothetical protein
VASALLAVTVGGVAVLSAACSRAPDRPAAAAARPSPASARTAAIDPNSLKFRSAARICQAIAPTATVRIVTADEMP